MRTFLAHSLKRVASIATCGHCGGDDTSSMYGQDAQATSRHSRHSAEKMRRSTTASSNPSPSTRDSAYPTTRTQCENGTDTLSKSLISIHSDKGERSSPRKREQAEPCKETDSTRSRRYELRGMDYPPKATTEVIAPPPIHTFGGESAARPSTTFQQLYETQSRELIGLRRDLQVKSEERQALEDAYATLLQQYEEKSWKLNGLRDENRVALEQKKRAEKDCAVLRKQYEAEASQRRWDVRRDRDVLRRESGVQACDLGTSRHERCVPLEEHRVIADAYGTLKQQYKEQSKELVVVRHRHQQAESDRAVLGRQREEDSRSFNAVYHECQVALEQKEKLQKDYVILRQEYEAQKNQNNALRENNRSLKAAFEQRTSELHGVEKFLTTADTYSGAEVVSTLRMLNAGVQQSITSMVEWMVDNLTLDVAPADQPENVEQTRASELLGIEFWNLLGEKTHKDNPILLEIALQAYLMYELYHVASQQTITQEDKSHITFINGIYQRMREAEGQAISGNWRALMHLYTAPTCTSDPERMRTAITTILSGLSDVLLAASCTTSKPDITSMLTSKFAKKIQDFVSLAGHVNKIIRAGVVSEDFEVLVVSPGMPFDGETMVDWDDDGVGIRETSSEVDEPVLCAMELGLVKRVEGGQSMIVIKPKIALVSVLDIIDG